jgi:hypothetical protein
VVGVQDEQHVERLGDLGSTSYGSAGKPNVIRRKFSTRFKRVVRVQERLAHDFL